MDLSTTFASIRKQVAGLSVVALVTGLFATGVATAATGNVFSDVPADAWFAPYVNGLSEQGVIDSTSDMYRPGDLVNRAEMAKFAFMVSGLPLETAAEAPYKDVAMGQWYTDYVYTLTKNGIVSGDKLNGVPTGFFRPSDALNRAEAAKMLVNSAQMAEDLSGAPHFPDVTTSDWFYNYVETLFNNGVVAGYPDGYFRPANNINRAEVAKMVYLSMNPVVAGFTLDSAAAASATKVELIFSMNVDSTSAEVVANYAIEDSSGTKLEVTDAEVVAGDTVHLTTKTQTAGKVYYVTVKDIESEAGDMLANWDAVSFLGYGADVSGGPLTVSLSTQTPVAGSIPMNATGVVFTCWDFKAGSEDAVVKSLHVHRVGPGPQTDFANVYLYRGDTRLTTGRSINSETQLAEFNNINQTVKAGENAKMCLVADLNGVLQGGVHAFQLLSADHVVTNSSDLTGSFPLRGADQLITSATVGATTIKKNGSLDELTVGQKDARIAQFELTANGSEDQELKRIALYFSGAINASELTNLKLYATGEATAVASVSEVGAKSLATFTLAKPFKIGRGQNKIFYVTADVGGRDGDDIKTYLDTPTDLYVTGTTYGYGTQVRSSAPTGSYDGAGTNYSVVTLKGGMFNVAFTGPTSGDIASGQKQAHCLDITITNNGDSDIEIRDWPVALDILNVPAAAGGLTDGTTANYSLIKLARINEDGSVGGSLLGPSELTTPIGGQTFQRVTLSGTSNIAAGQSVKAAVIFDVRSANAAMANDQIRCTIADAGLYAKGLVDVPNGVKTTDQNKQLDDKSITPASPIVGNVFTIKPGALTVALSATPSSQTYTRGSSNVALAGFSFTAGSSLDQTIKSITLNGQIDANNDGTFAAAGTGTETAGGDTSILSNVIDSGVALYDGATKVSDVKNINSTTGQVVFNNLDIKVDKSTTKNLVLRGNVSNSAPFGTLPDKVKFSVVAGTDLIVIDQNGQTVDAASIVTTDANQTAVNNVVMTITSAGSGTVSKATSDAASAVAGANEIMAGKWTFTSTNDSPMLKDLDFVVANGSPASVQTVKLYNDSACTNQVGALGGYSPLPSGLVQVRDLNQVISTSSTYTLCAKVLTGTVNTDPAVEPKSGSTVGLVLASVSKVSSGSGVNVAQRYAADINDLDTTTGGAQTATLNAALGTVGNPALLPAGLAGNFVLKVGDVLQIGGEMMLVTTAPGAVVIPAVYTPTVLRGYAGTIAASHSAGAEVGLSRVSLAAAGAASVKAGDVYYDQSATGYCLALSDAGVTFADLDGLGAVTCGAPVVGDSYFPLHGALSSLFRSVPQVSGASTGATGSAPDAVMVDINIKAVGDKVKFNSGVNQIKANISKSVAGVASTCDLVQVAGPGSPKNLHTGVALAAATGTQTLTFNFATSALDIAADDTVRLEVRCNSINALSGGGAGTTMSGSLPSLADVITWDDYVFAGGNINFAGQYIVPVSIPGRTITL